MKTQLFFDLTARQPCPSIYFRESEEVEETVEELREHNIAILEIDGRSPFFTGRIVQGIRSSFKEAERLVWR